MRVEVNHLSSAVRAGKAISMEIQPRDQGEPVCAHPSPLDGSPADSPTLSCSRVKAAASAECLLLFFLTPHTPPSQRPPHFQRKINRQEFRPGGQQASTNLIFEGHSIPSHGSPSTLTGSSRALCADYKIGGWEGLSQLPHASNVAPRPTHQLFQSRHWAQSNIELQPCNNEQGQIVQPDHIPRVPPNPR